MLVLRQSATAVIDTFTSEMRDECTRFRMDVAYKVVEASGLVNMEHGSHRRDPARRGGRLGRARKRQGSAHRQ